MIRVQLRPFKRDQLPLAEPWFQDADTQRWLGGPDWPRLMLDLAERPLGEFRGAVETGRRSRTRPRGRRLLRVAPAGGASVTPPAAGRSG